MRAWVFAAVALWATPVLSVGALGAGLPVAAALAAGLALACVAAWLCITPLARLVADVAQRPLAPRVALGAAAAAAIAQIATISVFMADVHRPGFSAVPEDPFRLAHSCSSSYAEAARLHQEGGHNIYDGNLYQPANVARTIGPLNVDMYHYPPSFLLLPQAIRVVAPDFWSFRRVWFMLQALVLAAVIVGLSVWIGGGGGAIALTGGLLVLSLPETIYSLQQGNFQITATPLGVAAAALVYSGRAGTGGTLLSYMAIAKIFPGILAVLLVTGRRWRALAWVAGAGIVIVGMTLAIQGTRPTHDFITKALPEISDGTAFPHTERPQNARVNWTIYGVTTRLRALGVPWFTQPRGLMISQVYGVLIIGFAAWAGWRRKFDLAQADDRIALAQVAVALVGLASFRSPFAGSVYGCVSTLWLMSLLAARAPSVRVTAMWLAGLAALALAIWQIPSPGFGPRQAWVWGSGLLFLLSLAINVWGVTDGVRTVRGEPRPAGQPALA